MPRSAWLKTFRTGYAFCLGILLCNAAPATAMIALARRRSLS